MIKYIKIMYYKMRLLWTYRKIRIFANKQFSLRMKSIRYGERFNGIIKALIKLGYTNPKEIVIGKR